MNDPDDTQPTGRPDACAESTDPGSATDDTLPDELEESPDDTDSFLRWLPTMWLSHRRRKELVQRPSSNGADFAAYAYQGRPARPSVRLRPEPSVHVKPSPAAGSRPVTRRGDAQDGGRHERDAPTVLTRTRTTGARAARVGSGALCVLALSAAVAWTHRRSHGEAAASGGAGAAPSARVTGRESKPREPSEGPLAVSDLEPRAEKLPAHVSLSKTAPPPKRTRQGDTVGAMPAGVDAIARTRPPPLVATSDVASKEQFFEAP